MFTRSESYQLTSFRIQVLWLLILYRTIRACRSRGEVYRLRLHVLHLVMFFRTFSNGAPVRVPPKYATGSVALPSRLITNSPVTKTGVSKIPPQMPLTSPHYSAPQIPTSRRSSGKQSIDHEIDDPASAPERLEVFIDVSHPRRTMKEKIYIDGPWRSARLRHATLNSAQCRYRRAAGA